MSAKRRPISLETIDRAAEIHRTGDEADSFMSKLDEILGRRVSTLPVGRADCWAIFFDSLMIDEHEWKISPGERFDIVDRIARQNK